jgi:hypothetical protein
MKAINRIEKRCPTCKQTKPVAEFYKNKSRCDGLDVQCKICNKKRMKNYYKNGAQYQNSKTCAQYFGICIAEKLLEKAFKNAQRAKFGNKGYDFICGKGYKVDSKISVFRKIDNHKKPGMGWIFSIKYNKTAEWFACFAFDNRTSLTPLYFWLIPGKDINNVYKIAIRLSTLHKWAKYEQPLDKIELACSTMKGEQNGD